MSARDIPQIHLLLGKFECKKLLIKNYAKILFIRLENFLISENMHFWSFSDIFKFNSQSKILVLTKILQIDQKLIFKIFHVLNQYRIFKIEKNIWWHRPPPKKNGPFGGSGALKYKDFGYVSGRQNSVPDKYSIFRYTIHFSRVLSNIYICNSLLLKYWRKQKVSEICIVGILWDNS